MTSRSCSARARLSARGLWGSARRLGKRRTLSLSAIRARGLVNHSPWDVPSIERSNGNSRRGSRRARRVGVSPIRELLREVDRGNRGGVDGFDGEVGWEGAMLRFGWLLESARGVWGEAVAQLGEQPRSPWRRPIASAANSTFAGRRPHTISLVQLLITLTLSMPGNSDVVVRVHCTSPSRTLRPP